MTTTQPDLFTVVDVDLDGDIDDLLPPGRPMVDVRCALLEDSDRDGDL